MYNRLSNFCERFSPAHDTDRRSNLELIAIKSMNNSDNNILHTFTIPKFRTK